ncbi:CGNR zinc finger domain-containing protein [Streptacidiphilus cavernicola]|uniref:ABATE domain-containing protein n=1 Tax=Streptacidiphilus cavernicola TaxID=3342716 RepID=A0ABV6W2E6_9ACTN
MTVSSTGTVDASSGADADVRAPRFRTGSGRLCLDFLRTLRHRGTLDAIEELADAAALLAWVVQCGPCDLAGQPAAVDAGQLRDAHSLREAVYELVMIGRTDGGVSTSSFLARELVNRAAKCPPPVPRVDASGALLWTATDAVAATMSLVARDAIDLVTSAALGRVRECADESCSALFSDNSRPGNRRWCSMGACGNRAKKNGIRSRAAAR